MNQLSLKVNPIFILKLFSSNMPFVLGLTFTYCPEMLRMDLLLNTGSPKPTLTPY